MLSLTLWHVVWTQECEPWRPDVRGNVRIFFHSVKEEKRKAVKSVPSVSPFYKMGSHWAFMWICMHKAFDQNTADLHSRDGEENTLLRVKDSLVSTNISNSNLLKITLKKYIEKQASKRSHYFVTSGRQRGTWEIWADVKGEQQSSRETISLS